MTDSFDDATQACQSWIERLAVNDLILLGYFSVDKDEIIRPELARQPVTVALIGNAGSAIWPRFQAARRRDPGLSLDRWTKEVVDPIAGSFGLGVVYPFEGPPYWPFTRWAERSATLFASPLGLTIHPTFGLWHAFRCALLLGDDDGLPSLSSENPCADCADRPCLDACPVGAFAEDGYDFQACLDHVGMSVNQCRQQGCLARAACPIGQGYRYLPNHAAFHMIELLKTHGRLDV